MTIPGTAALLLVDLQRAIDDPSWGVRNHPDAEVQGARLLAGWRESGRAVFLGSRARVFKPEILPRAGEPVIAKQTGSAFVGTELQALLQTGGHKVLVVFGVITNNSVKTTVCHAACLGIQQDRLEEPGPDHRRRAATPTRWCRAACA